MRNIIEFIKSRKLISIIVLVILTSGIVLGVYLIRQQQIIKSRAAGGSISFTGPGVSQKSDGTWITLNPQVTIQVSSGLGPPP